MSCCMFNISINLGLRPHPEFLTIIVELREKIETADSQNYKKTLKKKLKKLEDERDVELIKFEATKNERAEAKAKKANAKKD